MSTLLAFVAALLKALFGWAVANNKPQAIDSGHDDELEADLNSQIADLPDLPDAAD